MIVTRRGVEIDLSAEGKVGCPRCISTGGDRGRDNLHVYGLDDDGKHLGAYCWSCCYTLPSHDHLAELTNNDEEEDIDQMGSEFNKGVQDKLKETTGMDSKGYRGIRSEISKKYRVRYQYSQEDGKVAKTLYPCTTDYGISGYKIRTHPKNFQSPGPMGETGKGCDLFGQFLFKNSSGKYIVVTSGEHDALAAYQMLEDYRESRGQTGYDHIPVVSPTIGEAGAYKQIQKQYEWLNRFERIIYVKDPDEAGQRALEKIAGVVPKRKLYVLELSTVKDPNEAVEKGREKEFISKFFSATPYVPSGIVGSGELLEKMKSAAMVEKIPLPPFMKDLQTMMAGGIPLKRIVCLGSASGSGKSTICDEMVYHWLFHSPHKVGILSLESDGSEYGNKILSRHIGQKIDLIERPEDKVSLLSSDAVEEQAIQLFRTEDGSHRFHLIEERDGTLESVQDLVMQLIVECEAKVVIIDPLQDLLDGTSNEEQATFMRWLKGMVKSHDVTFILINHVRKSTGGAKANSTGADLHEEDFQGSSSIFKSSSCNLLFTRDKESENNILRNTTKMKCTKLRWTGRTSPLAGEYYYDNETHTLHDLQDYLGKNPSALEEYLQGNSEA